MTLPWWGGRSKVLETECEFGLGSCIGEPWKTFSVQLGWVRGDHGSVAVCSESSSKRIIGSRYYLAMHARSHSPRIVGQ